MAVAGANSIDDKSSNPRGASLGSSIDHMSQNADIGTHAPMIKAHNFNGTHDAISIGSTSNKLRQNKSSLLKSGNASSNDPSLSQVHPQNGIPSTNFQTGTVGSVSGLSSGSKLYLKRGK